MIEIINYEKADKGKIVAFIDIQIPKSGLIFRKIAKVLSNDKIWYNMPSFSKEMPDMTKKFFPYIEFTHNSKTFFEELAKKVEEYEKKMQENPQPPVEEILDFDLPF